MADIRLISFIPPQQNVTPTAVSQEAGRNNLQSTVKLNVGEVLSGYIINRDASGNPILRTESGDVTFSSNFFLKIGSKVVIRVESDGAKAQQARILSVDGKPPEVAVQQSAFAKDQEIVTTHQFRPPNALSALNASVNPAVASVKQEAGVIVYGTLVKASATTATATSAPTEAPESTAEGATLAIKIIAVTPGEKPPASPATQQAAQAYRQAGEGAATTPTSNTPQTPVSQSYSSYARNAIVSQPAQPQPQATQPTVTPQSNAQPATAPTNTPPVANVVQPAQTQPQATAPTTANVQPPSPQTVTTTSAPQITPETPTSNTSQTPAQPAAPQAAQAQPLTSQNTVPVAEQPESADTPIQSNIRTATVLSREQDGKVILQTSAGLLRIPQDIELPVGSKVTYRLVQVTPAPLSSRTTGALPSNTTSPAPLVELGTRWQALQQVLQAIRQIDGTNSPEFANLPIPSISTTATGAPVIAKDFAPGLFVFMTLLKGGSIKDWFGEERVQKLKTAGFEPLMKTLDSDIKTLSMPFSEPKPGQWQSLFFPVMVDGELQQLRFYVKRDPKDSKNEQDGKDEPDTRFMIELDLSKLGEMQIDGYIRQPKDKLNFELVIRTHEPLEPEVQQQIQQVFTQHAEAHGFTGSVRFQATKQFAFSPFGEVIATHNEIMA